MDRYVNEPLVHMPHPNGGTVPTVMRKPDRRLNQAFITHLVVAGEHFWTLADKYYSNTMDWWVIAEMNPAVASPDDLFWGLTILIPQ